MGHNDAGSSHRGKMKPANSTKKGPQGGAEPGLGYLRPEEEVWGRSRGKRQGPSLGELRVRLRLQWVSFPSRPLSDRRQPAGVFPEPECLRKVSSTLGTPTGLSRTTEWRRRHCRMSLAFSCSRESASQILNSKHFLQSLLIVTQKAPLASQFPPTKTSYLIEEPSKRTIT